MDILKDTVQNYDAMNNNMYKQLLINQTSFNFNTKDSILITKDKINNNKSKIENDSKEIDHNSEALMGNFFSSIVLLNENKININDIYNEEGDTLLHLACKYSDLNVIRALIEKFGCNINIKNNLDQTPFYKLCDNRKYDNEIISYFLQRKDLIIETEDIDGINPLLLTIKNKNINLFYALCSIGSNLNHKDKKFHDVYYYALKYDNLPVLKYLLKFSKIDIFSSNTNLTPILVTSEGSSCCKYLLKYHYKKMINGITQPLNKENYQPYEFNLFNYELISTCYTHKNSNFLLTFFKIILPKNQYYFKPYNIKFLFLNLIIRRIFKDYILRKISFFYYCFIIFLLAYFYIDLRQFNLNVYDIISLFTSIITIVLCYNLYIRNLPEKNANFYEKFFNPSFEKKSDSILGICEIAYKNNILDLPGISEDCPRCLIKKRRNIQHCNRCDCCVKNFYFHSNLLGICINDQNALNYSLLNLFFGYKQFSFICLIYNILLGNEKYNWGFSFYKFLVVLIEANMLVKLFSIILFINASLCIGVGLSTFLCIGYNVNYYLTYREEKIPYGRVVQRKINNNYVDYLAPIVNMVGLPEFLNNLLNKRKEIEIV